MTPPKDAWCCATIRWSGLDTYAVNVLIHEFFHATQYGYPNVMNDRTTSQDEQWLIEGMAKTVEELFFSTEMLRSLIGGLG